MIILLYSVLFTYSIIFILIYLIKFIRQIDKRYCVDFYIGDVYFIRNFSTLLEVLHYIIISCKYGFIYDVSIYDNLKHKFIYADDWRLYD